MRISRFCLVTTACLLLAASLVAFAAPGPKKQGFEAYALLRTRNIFDPERQPGATAAASVQSAPGHGDFAALTGILVTPEKTLAFFSGSRPEYNSVLPVGGTITGARLTRISADTIEIERDGKHTLIAVGQTVPLDAASVPGPAPTIDVSATAAPSPASDTPSSSPAGTAPATANREALIRRMMEKRQKELQ